MFGRKKDDENKIEIRKKDVGIMSRDDHDPFEEFERAMRNFERAFFEMAFRTPFSFRREIVEPEIRAPFVDMIDTGKEFKVIAEMPGATKDKIDISISGNTLEISSETGTESESTEGNVVHRERSFRKFYRCIELPEDIIPEKATSKLNNGVLEIVLPKKNPTEKKKVKVNIE
ncbi:MAG: Hsp20/alpha crystallin family protein [Thermoplasmata archaeon]|nr:Hsp20/alpha crystallin family protein [Thermoplasmata archaeon]